MDSGSDDGGPRHRISSSVDSDSFPPPLSIGGGPPPGFARGRPVAGSDSDSDSSSDGFPAPQGLVGKGDSKQSSGSGRRRRQRSKFFDYDNEDNDPAPTELGGGSKSKSLLSDSWSSDDDDDDFNEFSMPNTCLRGPVKGPGYWILTPHGKQWHRGRPCTDHLMLLASQGDRKRFGREKATEKYEKLLREGIEAVVKYVGKGGDDDEEQGVDSIMDEGFVHYIDLIRDHDTLKCLCLEFNGLTKKAVKALADQCLSVNSPHTLEELSLSRNPGIGDMGSLDLINSLNTNVTLKKLDLTDCRIGKKGSSALAIALTRNKSLTSVNLSSNEIRGKGLAELFDALTENTTLRELILNDCGSCNTCNDSQLAAGIRRGIEKTKSLEVLDISGLQMPGSVFAGVCDGLTKNGSLKTLCMGHMMIDSNDCVGLCAALSGHPRLEQLALNDNQVNGAGVDAVWKLVKENSSLRSLNVARNRFFSSRLSVDGPRSVDAPGYTSFGDPEWISDVLKFGNISSLNLRGIGLKDEQAHSIGEGLRGNTRLVSLDVGEHWFEEEGMQAIADGLEDNDHLTSLYFLRDKMHYQDFPEIEMEVTDERAAERAAAQEFHDRLARQGKRIRRKVEDNQERSRREHGEGSFVYMDDDDFDWDFEDGFNTAIF